MTEKEQFLKILKREKINIIENSEGSGTKASYISIPNEMPPHENIPINIFFDKKDGKFTGIVFGG